MGLKTYTMTNPKTYAWQDFVNGEGAKAIVDLNLLNRGFESARIILALADKSRVMLGSPSNLMGEKVGDHGNGRRAVAIIGTGANGTVDVRVKKPGLEGNKYTIEVITTTITNQPLTANLIGDKGQDLRLILATNSSGQLDGSANTANQVAAAFNDLTLNGEQIFVAEAGGNGGSSLTAAVPKKPFQGGVEGKDYAYKISALDDSGETLASDTIVLQDCHPAMNDDYYIGLSWDPVPGAKGYKRRGADGC